MIHKAKLKSVINCRKLLGADLMIRIKTNVNTTIENTNKLFYQNLLSRNVGNASEQ